MGGDLCRIVEELGMLDCGLEPCAGRRRETQHGTGQSGGIVTIHSKTQEITRCGQYWAFAHYSKLMQRGARGLALYQSRGGGESRWPQSVSPDHPKRSGTVGAC